MARQYTKHSEHTSLTSIMDDLQSGGVVKGFSTRKKMVHDDYLNDRKALQQYVSNTYQKLYKQSKEISDVFNTKINDTEIKTEGLSKRLQHLADVMGKYQAETQQLKTPTKTGKKERIKWGDMDYDKLVDAAVHYQNQLAKGPMVEYKRLRAQAKDMAKIYGFNTDEDTVTAVLLAWDTILNTQSQEEIKYFSDGEGNFEFTEANQETLLKVITQTLGITYNEAVEKYIKKRKK